jgi:hypothetical protein
MSNAKAKGMDLFLALFFEGEEEDSRSEKEW